MEKTLLKEASIDELTPLKAIVRHSAQAFQSSKLEEQKGWDLYHGRGHLTAEQENILKLRGQPKQIHNIVKEFTLKLSGYLSATRKEVAVKPVAEQYSAVANVANTVVERTMTKNNTDVKYFQAVQQLLISGVSCLEHAVYKTGEKDQYGRPMYGVKMNLVPSSEIFLDPWSRELDYSDAQHFTRKKWIGSYDFERLFGKEKLKQSSPFTTVLADLGYEWDLDLLNSSMVSDEYRELTVYEVLHTIVRRGEQTFSYYWNNDMILIKEDVTKTPNPFRYCVQRLFLVDRPEYYGIFRDLFGTQEAVNQSIIAMQHMINTSKVLVEKGAVDNITKFAADYNKINGVAEVADGALKDGKIKIEKFTIDLVNYQRKLEADIGRAERSIPMNAAFQGLAPASDSGTKVELQQTSVIVGQTYATIAAEGMLRQWALGTLNIIKQYWQAEQVYRITDGQDRDQWVKINEPVKDATGNMVFQVALDPDTDKPLIDENGKFVMAPVMKSDNAIGTGEYELEMRTQPSGLGRQSNKELLLFALQSTEGLIPPEDKLNILALFMKNEDAKDSEKMAEILKRNADAIAQQRQLSMAQPGSPAAALTA